MCGHDDAKNRCQKPENLKGKPEDCTPEQIRECHGSDAEHACQPQAETRQQGVDDK